jgi:flagellar biosynthesis/type III secretory pathway M-ring protein FliF/YscJ
MANKEKKPKKKFQLDYMTSLILASFLLAIAYDCFQQNKGQGFGTANSIIALILVLISVFIMFKAIKKVAIARRDQLIAQYEQQQKAAEEAEYDDDEELEFEDEYDNEEDSPDEDNEDE